MSEGLCASADALDYDASACYRLYRNVARHVGSSGAQPSDHDLDVPLLADVYLYGEHDIDTSSNDGAVVPDSHPKFYSAVPSGDFHLTN